MVKLKKSDLKNMNELALKERLNELNKDLIKSNTQIATHTTPENPGKIRAIKKTIAQINTILNQKFKEVIKKA
ncbi:MAG: 50S ribosomal protein L29 [Candidatus Woesearchaeota archaeon]